MTRAPELEDLQFQNFYNNKADKIKYDLDSMYNMQDINNTQAIGYDNLDKKSGSADSGSTFENAHTDVFDKLLADYYLSQRGDYAQTNKMMG